MFFAFANPLRRRPLTGRRPDRHRPTHRRRRRRHEQSDPDHAGRRVRRRPSSGSAKFVWPPLMRAIETRQKQIADGPRGWRAGPQRNLASAEKRDAEMLAAAKARSAEIVAIGEKFKAETIEAGKVEAPRRKPSVSSAAKAEIAQEVAREGISCRRFRGRPRGRRRGEDPERDVARARGAARGTQAPAVTATEKSSSWPNSPPSPVPTPKWRSLAREQNTLPVWSEC